MNFNRTAAIAILRVISIAVIAFSVPVSASAAPTTLSRVAVVGINPNADGTLHYGGDLVPEVYNTVGSTAEFAGTKEISGLGGDGEVATTTLTYEGKAQADSGGLKAAVSGIIENPFYNVENPKFAEPGIVTPDGIPDYIRLDAWAGFQDTLSVTGADDLTYLVFTLGVSGLIDSANGASPSVQVAQNATISTTWASLFYATAAQNYDASIETGAFNVSNGEVVVDLYLGAMLTFNRFEYLVLFADYYERFGPLGGSIDFFNTVTIDSVAGYNSSGAQVPLYSVTGSDGFDFTLADFSPSGTSVPEPSALLLVGAGLLGVFASCRSRGARRHETSLLS